jgi:hypothetical protein
MHNPEGVSSFSNGATRGTHVDHGKALKYEYQPLEDDDSIRILTLAPGKQDDPLKGTLEVVNVDLAGSYEPISYVWGEPGPPNCRYDILVSDGDEERLLDLRGGSLLAALRRLRLLDRERRVWADQVCINQDNLDERGQQVQFMNKIYKNASRVIVWVGLDDENEAEPAFQLIHEIDKTLQDEVKRKSFHIRFTGELDDQSKDEWEPLRHLTSRSWVSSRSDRATITFSHLPSSSAVG